MRRTVLVLLGVLGFQALLSPLAANAEGNCPPGHYPIGVPPSRGLQRANNALFRSQPRRHHVGERAGGLSRPPIRPLTQGRQQDAEPRRQR